MVVVAIVTVYDRRSDRMPFVHGLIRVPYSGSYTLGCSLLPGNQILIRKYLARRGVAVSGGWSTGSGWQQTTTTICTYYLHNMRLISFVLCNASELKSTLSVFCHVKSLVWSKV